MYKILITLLISVLFTSYVYSQEAIKPRPSPTAIVTMKFEDTYLKITYCQPHKKGRDIFGDLVPYGEVWRTGANEATEITVTKDVTFAGKKLEKGTYSLFTIPGKKEWTIILNSELGLWGAYNYKKENDVMRVSAKSKKIDQTWEPFTISFEQKDSGADLVMHWDNTEVVVPISFK